MIDMDGICPTCGQYSYDRYVTTKERQLKTEMDAMHKKLVEDLKAAFAKNKLNEKR